MQSLKWFKEHWDDFLVNILAGVVLLAAVWLVQRAWKVARQMHASYKHVDALASATKALFIAIKDEERQRMLLGFSTSLDSMRDLRIGFIWKLVALMGLGAIGYQLPSPVNLIVSTSVGGGCGFFVYNLIWADKAVTTMGSVLSECALIYSNQPLGETAAVEKQSKN